MIKKAFFCIALYLFVSSPLHSYPNSTHVFLTTDVTAPSTAVILSGTIGNQDWFTSPVSVTLNAVDDQSGVASTFYTINDGLPKTYTTPFSLTTDGSGRHIIEYWSVDVAGNTETHKFRSVRIDFTAPVTQARSAPLEFDVGLFAAATATADLNNDAHLDILTANSGSSTVSLLFGDGTGQFDSRLDLITPQQPIDVLAADLNNDGNNDIAAIGSNPSSNGWVFLGNGTGGFGSPITFSAGSSMNSFTSADLNRDGNLDLVGPGVVLFGNGSGGFPSLTKLPIGFNTLPVDVATADFNGDGKKDVATANHVSQNITIFFGDGTGAFSSPLTISAGNSALLHVAATDLNNDGNTDLVTNSPETLYIFLGDGDGTFSSAITKNLGTSGEKAFALDDFNDDGIRDVILTDTGFHTFYVLLGVGDGSVNLEATISVADYPRAPITGDFNEDGISDIAMVRSNPAGFSTLPVKVAVFLTTDLIVPSTSAISNPISVILNASDRGSGVASTFYTINGGPVQTYTSTLTFPTDGSYTIEYWSVDVAGNTETHKTRTLRIDSTAPVTQAFVSGTAGTNGWYGSAVEVSLNATDNLLGVQSTSYRIDGGTIQTYIGPFFVSTLGQHTVEYWSVDSLNNTEATHSLIVKIDNVAPATSAILSGIIGNQEWFTSSISVTLNAVDDQSGVASTFYTINDEPTQTYTSPFTLSADGNYTIEYWSVDVAGNTETHQTRSVRIDSTAPVTQLFVSGTTGTNGWYRSAVQVSLIATDNLSGVQSTSYRIDGGAAQPYGGPFVMSALGQHTIEYWSIDSLNNIEPAQSVIVKIDNVTPGVTAAANPLTANKSPRPITVTISGSVTDGISGVSSASFNVIDEYGATQPGGPVTVQANGSYSFVLTLPATKNGADKDGHLYTIVVTAFDQAENSASATTTLRIN